MQIAWFRQPEMAFAWRAKGLCPMATCLCLAAFFLASGLAAKEKTGIRSVIDREITAAWKANDRTPAEAADEAAFLLEPGSSF